MRPKLSALTVVMFLCALLFSGCTAFQNGKSKAEALPSYFSANPQFSSRVRAMVNCIDREYDFTLDWIFNADGSEITVTAPESIAGVKVRISQDTRTVSYAGAALYIPESISPLEALPLLKQCWSSPAAEYLLTGEERAELLWREQRLENELEYRTTFDLSRTTPLEASVFVNGEKLVTYVFDTFSVQ